MINQKNGKLELNLPPRVIYKITHIIIQNVIKYKNIIWYL